VACCHRLLGLHLLAGYDSTAHAAPNTSHREETTTWTITSMLRIDNGRRSQMQVLV